LSDEIDPVRW